MNFKSLSFIAVFALISLVLHSCESADKTQPKPEEAISVKVQQIEPTNLELNKEFVGQTKGAIDAEVRARVEGVIISAHFEEGKHVTEGQLLYTIDKAPYLAKVAEARGKLSQAETLLVKATSDLQRVKPLAQIKALSQKDLDAAIAQEGSAQGAVNAAKGAVEAAEIELSYCEITAPTTGIIGISKAKIGEFVGRAPNAVVINVVSKLDPIHVSFSVTEKEYLYFARLKQQEIATGQESAKRPLQLILADESVWPDTGLVAYVAREVDAATGSMVIEAAFPNSSNLLRPGQFAKIKVVAETRKDVLLVPIKAIKQLQDLRYVFVVGPDNVAQQKNIKLGASTEQVAEVESGLAASDLVIVEGLQRVKAGTKVQF
jgi:membrane fusion protein (multidrug efflux system)